jgi:hypothetical protein
MIPERARSSGLRFKTDSPFQVALPEFGSFKPDNVRSKVVLPAPFAPMIAVNLLFGTINETLFIALIAP